MISKKDYLFEYADEYDPNNEEGWALCDAHFNKRYKTKAIRKGRTLIECLRVAQKRGETLYLCKDFPDNIQKVSLKYRKKSLSYKKTNHRFRKKFNQALLILSQVDSARSLLADCINRGMEFVFEPKLLDEYAYLLTVYEENGKKHSAVFCESFSNPLNLAKTIVHEMHHSKQGFKDYEDIELDTKGKMVWDLQSYIFLTRVFEAEALVTETYFLVEVKRQDTRRLLSQFALEDDWNREIQIILQNTLHDSQEQIFAAAFIATFPIIGEYYDKGALLSTSELIKLSLKKQKGETNGIFYLTYDNIDKEVYRHLNIHGVRFGEELKSKNIDLLHPRFFGLDSGVKEFYSLRKEASGLSDHFNESSFPMVKRDKREFKNYMTRFMKPYKPVKIKKPRL